ncbi:hypothetical protein [Congregibacter sp.]|uniref:hypothetical protein n=1 Tax=Congregibacter sp. TaxID=2744308 RepID=UPI00385E755E
MKQRPDMLLVLTAVFGLGVVITLMLPMSANSSANSSAGSLTSPSVAAPPSPLQAGVVGSPGTVGNR